MALTGEYAYRRIRPKAVEDWGAKGNDSSPVWLR